MLVTGSGRGRASASNRKREQDRKAKVAEPVAIDHQKLHFYSTLAWPAHLIVLTHGQDVKFLMFRIRIGSALAR